MNSNFVTKYNGAKVESERQIGTVSATQMDGEGKRMLRIVTMKCDRIKGLQTHATVCVDRMRERTDGTVYSTRTTEIFGDYYQVIHRAPGVRCTAAAAKKQHDAMVAEYGDEVTTAAIAKYVTEAANVPA